MVQKIPKLLVLSLSLFVLNFFGQNEAFKWYFGYGAGLDFATTPPTILTNGAMNAAAGCASIADGAGNLLFYTNAGSVWDRTHNIMANGTGLNGYVSGTQNSIIIKKPASNNIYYIFTTGLSGGLCYTTIDMSLASGNGSVTAKNTFLLSSYYSQKLAAVRHCNGSDIWVVGRDAIYTTNTVPTFVQINFAAFLVTSAGVSSNPVLSPANTATWTNTINNWSNYDFGCMKISPNGKKLGLAMYYFNSINTNTTAYSNYELYDFNAATGAITNSLGLNPTIWNNINNYNNYGYGVEFSPDGTKFYGSNPYNNNINNTSNPGISQWDLCAGSNSAIIASQYTVAYSYINNVLQGQYASMQVAPDGKIYIAKGSQQNLAVINNPNLSGPACNFSTTGQSLSPKTNYFGLPNFMSSFLNQPYIAPPFTFTVNPAVACLTATFTAPTNLTVNCASSAYAVNNIRWYFGDLPSGAQNTSTLSNPTHNYPGPGTYTASLVYYYSCGTDTVRLPVNIIAASLNISTASITCASLGSATVSAVGGIGPYSYTWTPTAQTTSVATGLNPGTYSITVIDNGGNCAFTATTAFTSLVPFTGTLSNSSSITCNGAKTATANIQVSGGSGNNFYNWNDGTATYTTASVSTLGAGVNTVTVIDALTSCSLTQLFFINQPPALVLNTSASSSTVCANGSVTLTAQNSGGIQGPGPGYTYTWSGGPATDTFVTSQALANNYIYTVTSLDGNNCLATQTIGVGFIVNPILSVPATSICPFQTASLFVSGASSYTWSTGSNSSFIVDNPLVTTVYTVTGSALGCNSAAQTTTVFLNPIPSPTLQSNSPICNGETLSLSGSGGVSYLWTGPSAFNASGQSPAINFSAPINSGVYNLTVTAANSCTAATTASITVNPTPTLSVAGSTICVTQTLNLTSNTFSGASFLWLGPNSFTSNLQNPSIPNPATAMGGVYTLTVTSAQNCSNTASANVQVVPSPTPIIMSNSVALCFGKQLQLSGSGGSSYAWSGPNAFTSNLQNTNLANVTLAADGVYTLVVTTGPCISNTTQSITIHPLPTPSAFSSPVCETKSIQISVTGGTGNSFTWSGPNGYVSPQQNPTLAVTSLSQAGYYYVTETDENTCEGISSTFVNIMANPIITTSGTKVCLGYSAVVTASGAVTYTWSGPSGYQSTSSAAQITSANSSSPENYYVIGTAANGCTNTGMATLETMPLPTPSIVATKRACINDTVRLQGSGGSTYSWTGPYDFNAKKQSVNFKASNIAFNGIYKLTVSNDIGCLNSTTAMVIIDALPEGDLIGADVSHCVPFCSDFNLKPRNNSVITANTWAIGNQLFNAPSFSYCTQQAGQYPIVGTFTNDLGCVNTATFVINGYALPKADFTSAPEKPIEGFDEVQFTNLSFGEKPDRYNWYFEANRGYRTNSEHPSFTFDEAGTYPVSMVITNRWGCSDTVIKIITVESDLTVYVPNSFTPNDDGTNDLFLAKGRSIIKYSMEVFDRWGEKVFQTNDIHKGWDGNFKGQPCKSEVYVWKIFSTDLKGKSKSLNGFVTLYR